MSPSPSPRLHARLAIVGASVRGTSLLERVVAHVRSLPAPLELTIDVFDPYPPGSGRIWRDLQSQHLIMNTVAGQSTVFADESVTLGAPAHRGPTLAEWCRSSAAIEFLAGDEGAAREAAETTDASCPSRLLYGHYLRWAWNDIVASAPVGVSVRTHATRVIDLDLDGRRVTLRTDDGQSHHTDGVLLALGWLERQDSPLGAGTISPGNPIDQELERVTAGARVGVRGVGMGFYDVMSLLTEGRGGEFRGETYTATGAEPVLLAGSGRGVPFRAKPAFGTVPSAPQQRHLRAALPSLIANRPVDFARDVLPLIERDAQHDHAVTLHRLNPSAVIDLPGLLDAIAHGAYDQAVAQHISDPDDRLDLAVAAAPYAAARAKAPGASVDAVVAGIVAADAHEAALGADSAIKMGLHSYQAARAILIQLVTFGGLTPESVAHYERYLATAASFGSGPPLPRNRQLLALHDAGLVRFLGPRMTVSEGSVTDADGVAHDVDVVIEAWLPNPTVHQSADPLICSLVQKGLARGSSIAPNAVDIDEKDGALIAASGHRVEAVHSVGIPHQDLRIFTLISPVPRSNSTVLRETDAAAGGVLEYIQATTHFASEATP